jgi:hypothetical protein
VAPAARPQGRVLNLPSRRPRRSAIGPLLLVALLLGALAGPGSASARGLRTGISNVYANDAATMQRVREAGATISLYPVRWNLMAPSNPSPAFNAADPNESAYEWETTDTWVRNAVAAGITPVIQIRGAPKWAQRCTPEPAYDAICNPDPTALAEFTHAIVTHYSGQVPGVPQVRYWEAINEPNISFYFQPLWQNGAVVAPTLYRPLLEAFYAAVKAVDPSNLVLAPGLAPVPVPNVTIGPMKFTRSLLCMSGGAKPKPLPGDCGGPIPFDIFDIHPYTSGGPTHAGGPESMQLGDLGRIQALLTAAEKAGRIQSALTKVPIWITEFSWDSKPPDPRGLPMSTERQWIPEALHQAWLHGVPVFMWYSLQDTAEDQAGLYFAGENAANLRPKAEMYAFRFPFVAIRQGRRLSYWGKTPSGGGKVVLQVRERGRWRQLGTARADAAGIFRGKLATGYGSDEKGTVRAVFRKQRSPGFPMKRVPDHPVSPFG